MSKVICICPTHRDHRKLAALANGHMFLHHDYASALEDLSVDECPCNVSISETSDSLALKFLVAVSASHFAAFFFAVQVVGGLLLLSGYFVPLALILLAAELYNILAFRLMFQSGSGIGPGLLACVLWVLVFLQYRANFNSILTPKPASQP